MRVKQGISISPSAKLRGGSKSLEIRLQYISVVSFGAIYRERFLGAKTLFDH